MANFKNVLVAGVALVTLVGCGNNDAPKEQPKEDAKQEVQVKEEVVKEEVQLHKIQQLETGEEVVQSIVNDIRAKGVGIYELEVTEDEYISTYKYGVPFIADGEMCVPEEFGGGSGMVHVGENSPQGLKEHFTDDYYIEFTVDNTTETLFMVEAWKSLTPEDEPSATNQQFKVFGEVLTEHVNPKLVAEFDSAFHPYKDIYVELPVNEEDLSGSYITLDASWNEGQIDSLSFYYLVQE